MLARPLLRKVDPTSMTLDQSPIVPAGLTTYVYTEERGLRPTFLSAILSSEAGWPPTSHSYKRTPKNVNAKAYLLSQLFSRNISVLYPLTDERTECPEYLIWIIHYTFKLAFINIKHYTIPQH